ncbi:hypothetical protein LJK87_07010 [Paenibacillus sp. P25]|nr:hypothetical protein LJK87_07010 [Paenibacillus sp. P25]
MNKLQDIAGLDPAKLQPLLEQVQSAYYQLEDAAYQVRDYRDEIEFNPSRLDFIEQRLDTIASLRRKYGETVQDILAYLAKIQKELDLIENKDEALQKLQQQEEALRSRLVKRGAELTEQRAAVAERLAAEIVAELRDLHMERTQFKVQIDPRRRTALPVKAGTRWSS